MKLAVLGSGMVGQAIATKLAGLGHEVMMGSRQAGSERAAAWASATEGKTSEGAFADAAAFGEMILNATAGTASLKALKAAGAENLAGKVLIDVANPLDRSPDGAPRLSVCNTDSLGELIQREFPEARVVKTLNTVNNEVMVDPSLVPGPHSMFLCGNDAGAKAQALQLLESFGWPAEAIIDLGDITGARGTEMYLSLWVRLWQTLGGGHFNINVVKG